MSSKTKRLETRQQQRSERRKTRISKKKERLRQPHHADTLEPALQERERKADHSFETRSRNMQNSEHNMYNKRKEMLAALASKFSKKSAISQERLLNKTDKLADIAITYTETKLEDLSEGGLPLIMGIEGATLFTTGIIDLIPIPEIGLVGEAIEGASDAVISGITAIGPKPISEIIEEQVMPVIIKFAAIFQHMVGSLTCCPSKNRTVPLELKTKKSIHGDFNILKKVLNRLKKELSGDAKRVADINEALLKINIAEKGLKISSVDNSKTKDKRPRKTSRRSTRKDRTS